MQASAGPDDTGGWQAQCRNDVLGLGARAIDRLEIGIDDQRWRFPAVVLGALHPDRDGGAAIENSAAGSVPARGKGRNLAGISCVPGAYTGIIGAFVIGQTAKENRLLC